MLSREENELLTRVCGDAPMGQVLRRYWLPALLSDEVAEPDGAPVPVRLLGEDLVAFRDTKGRVGLVDERCPHRLASLVIGRNEDCGLTCIYHGWKFDVTGACVDMPTEPEGFGFKNRIRIAAYPTREAGGMVWTYMGPPESAPKRGDKDTACGFPSAGIPKPLENPDTTKYVRVTLFALPSTAFIPPPLNADLPAHTQIFVPLDDDHTMLFDVFHSQNGTPVDEAELRRGLHAQPGVDLDADWFRHARRENRWQQDRAAMRDGSWTGIKGFQNQDIAAQESMGRVVDRSREHLGTSDVAVIRMRRRMLETVRRLRAGEPLVGQDAPIAYERLASEQRLIPIDQPWQTVGAHAGEYAAT